ncbi:hypothetical protein KUTeg_001377 [Tegillarca granosa]|uniref:OTU domain-containing protein n=1 Tax=Tegillarca granosa TaxID=220873 RepID=A0ABQ9FRC7_TEGGR|nr:hypothetical protein KUTeg_001377 [Tegillarca granosa]
MYILITDVISWIVLNIPCLISLKIFMSAHRKILLKTEQGQRNMTRTPNNRQDAVSRKKEERAKRDAYRRERKIESYLADDENFPSFSAQLAKIGLQLRDIPGDGNCLFRALGDQLEGHGRNHYKHRFDVANFMMEHRTDFEPFVEDDVPFDRHVNHLKNIGVYAGNDAIVAFARLHQLSVVIHQLGAPFWLIQGCQNPNSNTRQLHIAYHNGDHYSSVGVESEDKQLKNRKHEDNKTVNQGQDGFVRAVRDTQSIEEEVMLATGCMDIEKIQQELLNSNYDVDIAIATLLQIMEMENGKDDTTSLASHQTSTDSGIWSDSTGGSGTNGSVTGTPIKHTREASLGESSGYGSLSSCNGGARPKLNMGKQPQLTAKQKKEVKKMEKKKRAEDRHRQKFLGIKPQVPVSDDEDVVTVVAKDVSMMNI